MAKADLRIPDMIVPRVLDIDFEKLSSLKRWYYIFDLDNTLELPTEIRPSWQITMKIHQAQDVGWIKGLVILSNVGVDKKWFVAGSSRVARVRVAAEQLQGQYLACLWPKLKPNPALFIQAIEMMDASVEETVVIGDQISKDIKGGNAVGALTILVNPLGPDMWLTAVIRRLKERDIRARLGVPSGVS